MKTHNESKKYLVTLIYLQIIIFSISLFYIRNDFSLLGAWMGKFAIYIFWLIAIAGILKRFKVKGVLKRVQDFLLINRRQLGILMFCLSLVHFMWNKGFSMILNGIPTSIPLFQIFGFFALVLSFPLLLTSNNFSVLKLGSSWKILHRLVYPVMFLLVLHTAMQGSDFQLARLNFGIDYTLSYALPSLIILILQIVSLVYSFLKADNQQPKTIEARVKELYDNTKYAKTIVIEIPQQIATDFVFNAGQHTNLSLVINKKEVKRSYSICDWQLNNNTFRLSVKKVEGGIMSTFINNSLQVGDKVSISQPFGNLFDPAVLKKEDASVVLWVGGSGITPMISIINYIASLKRNIKVKLFYSNSFYNSIMFESELEKIASEYDYLEILHLITKDTITQTSDLKNVKYLNTIINTDFIKQQIIELNDANHYICGPKQMMDVCVAGLKERGVNIKNINIETFSTKKEGKVFGSGQTVVESGTYICLDCGYSKYYQVGETFDYCPICLAGKENNEYEFWQKM